MVATMGWGEEAERRLNEIANCSAGGEGVTRFPFTQQHMAANEIIRSWMSKAGLTTRVDAAGTLIGRKEGSAGHKTFLIGSHQDSVRNGGRYDGTMGIVVACLAMEKLARDRTMLPFSVELLAFADEEGVRFPTALLGPRALAGTVDQAVLRMADQDGITLADALHKFGGDPSEVVNLKRESGETLGYLEVHIEQGPVLEREKTPIGIVTGICGIERNFVTFTGETGHAGTVPMTGRRDALVAAAEFITAVENAARRAEDLRATVGSLVLWKSDRRVTATGLASRIGRERQATQSPQGEAWILPWSALTSNLLYRVRIGWLTLCRVLPVRLAIALRICRQELRMTPLPWPIFARFP